MALFKQYLPAFFEHNDGDLNKINFETADELLAKEFFINHSKQENFSHFAMSDNAIMKVINNGIYLVIGFVDDSSLLNNLPTLDFENPLGK
jgi:hypothetical protein